MNEIRNNKGQTLVLFILLLPLFILLFALIVDYGEMSIQKNKIDSTIKNAIEYGLSHQGEFRVEKMNQLIEHNIKSIDKIDIKIQEEIITIKITKKIDYAFPFIANKDIKFFEEEYLGYIENGKAKIVRR